MHLKLCIRLNSFCGMVGIPFAINARSICGGAPLWLFASTAIWLLGAAGLGVFPIAGILEVMVGVNTVRALVIILKLLDEKVGRNWDMQAGMLPVWHTMPLESWLPWILDSTGGTRV